MSQSLYANDGARRLSDRQYDQSFQSGFQSSFYPANFQPSTQPPPQLNSASSYADLQYLFGVQDSSMMPVSKSGRNRKRSTPGGDHVKHRRTRSGCYTCRSRRVKCDEKRPICERCRKGGRECVYPEPAPLQKAASSSASKSGKSTTQPDVGSSSEESDEDDEFDKMDSIPDEDEGKEAAILMTSPTQTASQHSGSVPRRSSTRNSSETPSLTHDKGPSPTPSTEGSVGWNAYATIVNMQSKGSPTEFSTATLNMRSDMSHLPADLQFYLSYFCENITYHHYSLKYDSCDFLRTIFLDAALRNDALLHAVVGFSAFQHTLANPQGKIQDFLLYYNKAVSLLLKSLRKGQRSTLGTLLTILQLATIEEYLGDWMNLLGHQKAAYEILMELYTPQTVMQSDLTRTILVWYARFDVFAGLMAGSEAVMSREWFSSAKEYLERRIKDEPDNVNWKIEEAFANARLIAMDMSTLFSRMGKGEIQFEQFMAENAMIGKLLADWKNNMDPALTDRRWLVNDFTGSRPRDPETDIVDPYLKNTLYHGPIWATNQMMIDWYSVDLMHKYQTALILQSQPSKELAMNAYASCQLLEAIEFWPHSPKGSVVACQASLGIAALFLPQDSQHHMWCRRKLAVIEAQGYIYPLTFRTKMTALFRDPSCMHWWLPNEENYPPIVRSIRRFVEERTTPAKDADGQDLYDMKAIFASLKVGDGNDSTSSDLGKEVAGDSQEWNNMNTIFDVKPDLAFDHVP